METRFSSLFGTDIMMSETILWFQIQCACNHVSVSPQIPLSGLMDHIMVTSPLHWSSDHGAIPGGFLPYMTAASPLGIYVTNLERSTLYPLTHIQCWYHLSVETSLRKCGHLRLSNHLLGKWCADQ